MELVQGVPITEYCDQCNLSTRERLELFATVCQAVQHAHQKGIIHRDIKPTNVLVAIQDGRPTPKIIDFGVAKAINQQLTEHTLMTAFAQIIGTPLYMSPEQAELSPLGVDTRSDIYSLGVLLYELLTGTTPFDKDLLHSASYDELRRIIREEEPPRPSARISTLAADLATTVAEHRRTDARRLRQTVRGELDWIVMKCLEKDRNRRYDSVGSLQRDIERYLADEPVQACPPSVTYRLKKFVRRNKGAAAFIGLLLISVAALGVSNFAIKRERDAKTTALTRAQAVSDLLQQMLASSNPDQVKSSKFTVRELLNDFSAGLGDQLAGEPEVEASIRSVIGKSYWRLGVYGTADQHLKKALELRRQLFGAADERVADSLVDYAWNLSDQRQHDEAEKHVREALAIYRQQNSDPRAIVRALWSLQEFLHRQWQYAEAEEVANEALALVGAGNESDIAELANILHGLADAKSDEGKYEEAEKLASQSVELHRRLHGDQHPETAHGLRNLGRALAGQRKFAEAEPPLREAMAIFREYYTPEHRSIQYVTQELANVLQAQDDRAGLETLFRETTEEARRSDSPGYHVRLAALLLSNNPPNDAQQDEVHRLIRQAIEEYERLAVDYRDDLTRRLNAAARFVELIRICGATPGFSHQIDQLTHRLSADLLQITIDAKRQKTPEASADALYNVAVIQLQFGDEAGYRATCNALVDLPDFVDNDVVEARSIWILCLAPNSLDDLNLPVTRAERLIRKSEQYQPHSVKCVSGAALYRADKYDRAAKLLTQDIEDFPGGPMSLAFDPINYRKLFLAMTNWQLGQKSEARRLLAEVQLAVDKELQSPALVWSRRATLEILRREAEALIRPKAADEATENRDPTPTTLPRPADEEPPHGEEATPTATPMPLGDLRGGIPRQPGHAVEVAVAAGQIRDAMQLHHGDRQRVVAEQTMLHAEGGRLRDQICGDDQDLNSQQRNVVNCLAERAQGLNFAGLFFQPVNNLGFPAEPPRGLRRHQPMSNLAEYVRRRKTGHFLAPDTFDQPGAERPENRKRNKVIHQSLCIEEDCFASRQFVERHRYCVSSASRKMRSSVSTSPVQPIMPAVCSASVRPCSTVTRTFSRSASGNGRSSLSVPFS
jgi:serine/threonine protein kinase